MSSIWSEHTWLGLPQAAQHLGVEAKTVRSWVKDGALLALKHPETGKLCVPKEFLVQNETYAGPVAALRGTLTLLEDGGLRGEDAVVWLLTPEDSLGMSPIEALDAGLKKRVRQVASALAL